MGITLKNTRTGKSYSGDETKKYPQIQQPKEAEPQVVLRNTHTNQSYTGATKPATPSTPEEKPTVSNDLLRAAGIDPTGPFSAPESQRMLGFDASGRAYNMDAARDYSDYRNTSQYQADKQTVMDFQNQYERPAGDELFFGIPSREETEAYAAALSRFNGDDMYTGEAAKYNEARSAQRQGDIDYWQARLDEIDRQIKAQNDEIAQKASRPGVYGGNIGAEQNYAELERLNGERENIVNTLQNYHAYTDAGAALGAAAMRGFDDFALRTSQGLDWVNRMGHYAIGMTPEEYDNADTLTKQLVRNFEDSRGGWDERFSRNAGQSDTWRAIGEIVSGVTGALPYAALAAVSMGAGGAAGAAGLAGDTTAGLAAYAGAAQTAGRMAQTANMARTAVLGMLQDPQYWFTVLQEVGSSYDQAKEDGASEEQATIYAVGNSLLNAMVEIGGPGEGGIQNLERGAGWRGIATTAGQEANEELWQGVIERGLQSIYGKQNPVFSTTDPNAIFNPVTAGKEALMGGVVGGILGGGETAVSALANRAINALNGQNAQGAEYNDYNADLETTIQDLIRVLQSEQGQTAQSAETADILARLARTTDSKQEDSGQYLDEVGQQSINRGVTSQNYLQESADYLPNGMEDLTPETAETSADAQTALRESAQRGGMGKHGVEAIGQFYNGEDVSTFYGDFARAYTAGREGRKITVESAAEQGAWTAGRMDALEPGDAKAGTAAAERNNVFTKSVDKWLKAARKVSIGSVNGTEYITDGALAYPVGKDGAEHARGMYKVQDADLSFVETWYNSISKNPALTEQPVIAQGNNGKVYVFKSVGKQFGFDKNLLDKIDHGTLHIGTVQIRNGVEVPCLVSVNEDGKFGGLLLPLTGNPNWDLDSYKPGKLKSIRAGAKSVAGAVQPEYNDTKGTAQSESITAGHDAEDIEESAQAVETGSEKGTDRKPHEKLSDALLEKLKRGEKITAKDLASLAEQAFGGTRAQGAYDIKTAYDCLELAINRYLLTSPLGKGANVATAEQAVRVLDRIEDKLALLPTQTVRTEEQQQYQQFSTPPNIAYLAAWAANIAGSDVILEPSAGIGGLAVFGKAWGATVYGNELSQRRAEILRSLGLDEVFTENAEQINNVLPDYVQPSVVLMNPPFSATAGRLATNSTANAKRHIEQALDRLDDGGRLVAILGRGMSDDSKTFSRWWDDLRKKYSIRANLSINGENYKKYGTTFDVQLVVIDKTGPQTGETITGQYDDLADIPAVLEGIRNDRTRNEVSAAETERGSVERGDQSERPVGRDGGKPGRSDGNAERATGSASGDAELAGPKGRGDGGRVQSGRTEQTISESADRGDGSKTGQSVSESERGTAAESETERDARPESELSESGLTPAKKPRTTTATKASKNDDGVFTEYQPPATPVKGAKKHPAVLVESAAMGAVQSPEATYKPNLPKEIISSGKLSDAQISNIVYAGQAHSQMIPMQNKRKGYFIGDGTGVGKGRQISGIILDNFRQGRKKALWISKGQNLFPDAQRDWSDIGGNKADVFNLSKIKADAPIPAKTGIMFTTYDTLASASKSKKSRLDQIVDWLGEDFDGVIAFDEAHNMGNLLGKKGKMGATKPAQKAISGDELQKRLPKARVVYVSATMATDVNEMAFADRLGLWGPGTQFTNVKDFVEKISKGGIAAMELVARDMKAMGVYQARSISYNGVEYETLQHDLTPMQKEIYDTLSRAWQVTLKHVNEALNITGANLNGQARAAARSAYYGAMQRFYNQIITSMAVPSVIQDMKKELASGRSVVLQIVNTNEAETNRQLAAAKESGASLDDLDITPREALISFLRNSFPVYAYEEYTDENGNRRSQPVVDSSGKPVIDKKAVAMRDRMISEVESMSVPEGPLEMIFDAFGADQVAEVTGRKRRIVPAKDDYGNTVKVEEKRSEKANEADVQAFQDGKKRILIFSDAGGTGKSYHADLRAKNQQQRVHYLLQPGWSAPKAVQGFGRTHRSNEASAPIYKLVTTDVRGQKRFVSTIARRLDQLGALTKGQRQTGSGMFSAKDNLESELALDSLWNFYKQLGQNRLEGLDGTTILDKLGLLEKFQDEFGNFKMNDTIGRDMNTFLNRIMALEYDEQNAVFDAFSRIFDDAYDSALENGTLDMGMETVRADKIEILDDTVIRTDEATGATTNYVQAKLSEKTRILSTVEDLRLLRGDFLGIYRRENGHVYGVYRTADKTMANGSIQKQFILQTPQQGITSKFVESTFKNEMTRVPENQWAKAWAEEVKQAPTHRESVRHMLTGTLLPIWNRLPDSGNVRVQRLIADDGRQYLGRIIPPSQIDSVLRSLGAKARTKETYTPEQVVKEVFEKGKKAILENDRVTLTRRRVGNEWRIEISGSNLWYLQKNVPGIISEYINFQNRYFVPNGEKQAETVTAILKLNPLRDIEEGRADVQQARDSGGISPHPEEWTAERVGDKSKKPKPLSDIIEQIRHDYGINITTGHVRGAGIRGQYNVQNQGIRSRVANDLPVIAHELGHHLDDLYGLVDNLPANAKAEYDELINNMPAEFKARYKGKEQPYEGVAEYVRRFLQNSETAKIDYPEFTKYFLNSLSGPDMAKFMQLADEVNAYYSLDTESATSSIRLREEKLPDARTLKERVKDKWDALYQATVDSQNSVKRFQEATTDRYDVYKFATNSAYAGNRAAAAVTGDLFDKNGAYVCPGLKSCFANHREFITDKNLYKLLGEYLVVKHGPERLAEGKRTFADDRKNSTAWMQRRQAELERRHPELREISEKLYEFQRQFLYTWGVETGLVSDETFDEWGERWQFYVPFNRAVDESRRGIGARRGFANQNSTIHMAVGSGLDILHPVDNIINNMVKMINAGIRNDVMQRITYSASTMGDANFVEKDVMPLKKRSVSTEGLKKQLRKAGDEALLTGMFDERTDAVFETIVDSIDEVLEQYGRGVARGNTVTVLKNGKPEYWKVNDPGLLASITNMAPVKMGAVLEAYGAVSRFMTGNITGNNLLWSIFSNFPRDMMTFFTYLPGSKNPLKAFAAMGSAYVNKMRGDHADPLYMEYLAMGGGSTNAYTADRDMVKRAREKLAGKNISANPLDWIAFTADMIEMGPRFATYKLMRNNGMNPHEAFYEAMDVTVNFKRGGTVSRQINKFVPFFNASVQGLDKFARWLSAQDIPKAGRAKVCRSRTIGWIAVSAALGALFYVLNNYDDERKKEYQQLSNYTKNSYWNVPLGDGKFFAIPKPRELAVLSSLMETSAEYFHGKNEYAFDEFYQYFADTTLPNVVADVAQGDLAGAIGSLGLIGVGAYMMANRDFLGKPIESGGMQYLEPKDRYNERTSKIAWAVGQAFNLSPQMIDFFFQQTLGGWWKTQKALFPVGSENVDLTLGVQNTYIKDNVYSQDIVNRMYDYAEASGQKSKSHPDDIEAAILAKRDANMTEFYSRYLKRSKDNSNSVSARGTRQTVLDMILEYEKSREDGAVTDTERAVWDVIRKYGDPGDYLPSVMQNNIKDGKGKTRVLSDVQYVEYQTDYSRIYWETVENALPAATSDVEKAQIIRKAKEVAKEQATNRVLHSIGAPVTDYEEKYSGVSDEDVATFLALKKLAEGSDEKQPRDEVIEIIKKMQNSGLEDDDAYTLYHSVYSSDKNNPWRWHKN